MNAVQKTHAAQLAALIAAVGVGFAGGRLAAPDAPTAAAPARAPVAPAIGHDRPASPPVAPGAAVAATPQPTATTRSATADEAAGETRPLYPAKVDVKPLLAAARAAREHPEDEETCERASVAADLLLRRLIDDPDAIAETLAAFERLEDPFELADLAAVLGQVRDPEVEQAALRAVGDGSPARRAAAFDILDAIDSPAAREPALEALAVERDADVRRAAIRAIGEPAGASYDDARTVAAALARVVAADRDVESARSAATLIAQWAPDEASLAPALEALANDPRPAVRAGAAFAFEMAGRRSPAVVEALGQALTRPDEDPLVRENAYRALSRLSPLPPRVHAAFVAYGAERDAAGEDVGSNP